MHLKEVKIRWIDGMHCRMKWSDGEVMELEDGIIEAMQSDQKRLESKCLTVLRTIGKDIPEVLRDRKDVWVIRALE